MPHPALHHYLLPGLPVVACEYPHHPADDAAATAKRAVLADLGVTHLLDLTEAGELAPYPRAAGAEHPRWHPSHERLPVPDGRVPTSIDDFDRAVEALAERVSRGETVAVHCWGGIGRTGMVAAALLVRFGWPVEGALAEVNRRWRTVPKAQRTTLHDRTAPETDAQRGFVRDWARHFATRRARHRPPGGLDARTARACLLGGALGDALGASVEFRTLADIRAQHGPRGITAPHPAYGVDCPITDDTQMTVFTAEGLLRSMTGDAARAACGTAPSETAGGPRAGESDVVSCIGDAYVRWLFTQEPHTVPDDHRALAAPRGVLLQAAALHDRRAPGNTCLSALRTYARAAAPSRVAGNRSKGCGTVMRVAPIGLVSASPPEAYALAAQASALTHGHRTGIVAGGVFAAIVPSLRDGAPLATAITAARTCAAAEQEADETLDALDRAVALAARRGAAMTPEDLLTLGEGWVAEEALAIAVACALAHPTDFEAATCLAANLVRGDSDSTASMAGQLVGLTVGLEALPAAWLQRLELHDLLESVADDLAVGWRCGSEWSTRWPRCGR